MAHGGKRKGAGRKRGIPNRDTRRVKELIQEKYPGYHPLLSLAALAQDESLSAELRFRIHRTLAEFLEPRPKPIFFPEFESDEEVKITVNLGDLGAANHQDMT